MPSTRANRWPWAGILCAGAVACSGGEPAAGSACEAGTIEACACADETPALRACGADGTWRACGCGDLEVLPGRLDFGLVAPGSHTEATVAVVHRGDAPVPILDVRVVGDARFRLVDAPEALPAGGAAALFVIAFDAPVGVGSPAASLRIVLDVGGLPELEVPVTGRSWLACDSTALDLGGVACGTAKTDSIRCTSRLPDGGLRIGAVSVIDGDADAFQVRASREGPVPNGGSFEVFVTHRSTGEDEVHGTLRVELSSPAARFEIPLAARGVYARCELEIAAPDLRLLPGGTALGSLGLRVWSEEDCAIRSIRIDGSCDPEFELSGWPPSLVLREAGEPVELPVAVRSDRGGVLRCPIALEVADATAPIREVVLEARAAWDACVTWNPPALELHQWCDAIGHSVGIGNLCHDPLPVEAYELEGSPAFAISSSPVPPIAIPPGEEDWVRVTFLPTEDGEAFAALSVVGPDGATATLPIRGVSHQLPSILDAYQQHSMPEVDVLVVIDNGTGMAEEGDRILAALGALPDLLRGGADYHLAVTTASLSPSPSCGGAAGGGERGRIVPVDGSRPRIVTPATPDARQVWEENLRVGACHDGPNQAMEAARLALWPPLVEAADDSSTPEPADGNAGFYRPDAQLAIVFVGAREDASPGTDTYYYNALQSLKGWRTGGSRLSISAIAGDPATGCTGPGDVAAAPAERWSWLSSKTELGTFVSLCSIDAPFELPVLFGSRRCFFLGYPPADLDGDGEITDTAGEIEVRVDGAPVPAADGSGSVWHVDREQIAVCFEEGREPTWGATVEVSYLACPVPW